ncbi:bifunctional glutamate N-acetyltransferase/amino-acid acetyltransferase ArgJ [Streptomyces tauricus]|uniref:Arginine biosynthesis bifunctional protein ArgJ n=1 Tax=Streptomyces tauricus TaxID=68274 RepID=A0ABZ1JDX5_9ACTN|nr:bifunctional glutamate N-acetyltransferase/amino-acid acetyltransferase ArgJ [Streptomyces tauricus]MCW8097099.1 bifunctional glutamate N-acetyltransferase/amino-acid acetyltransferase ArgJ [Streptomyces tauricus]
MTTLLLPRGFSTHTGRSGIRDDRDDFLVVASDVPAAVSAVFTRSRFAGPSVVLSRAAASSMTGRGVIALSGNANVATGEGGLSDAREVRAGVARALGVADDELLITSTGLIGRRYPMPAVRDHLATLEYPFGGADFEAAAKAFMTTDTRHKVRSARCGTASLVGIAKGVGMMEPNMATLLTFFFTDAELEPGVLDTVFRRVIDRTFNALSIDTDTSTSDTAAVFANGLAGPVDVAEFERELFGVALGLVKDIARDGEGATKLIEVAVTGARDSEQARRVGKTIVNSPLVKTAVHGADPNWGRVAMALGKCEEDTDIAPENVTIGFGEVDVYPEPPDEGRLSQVAKHLKGDEVVIRVGLGTGHSAFRVYGCDLTEGYVRLNADYST